MNSKNLNSEKKVNRTPPTPKRIRSSIKLDVVNPGDFLKYDLTFSCEQCTHFDPELIKCTLGYNHEHHLKDKNLNTYYLNGKMAFCRFLEID